MIAGGLAQWKARLKMATPAELASLDQQVGATHPLRPLITEEVVTRSNAAAGVGAGPEFAPVQVQVPSAEPQAVPDFYNAADRQTVRDTGAVMDRIGEATGAVVTDVAGALRDTATDAAQVYDEYMPRIVEATGDVLAGWKDRAVSAYDKWMPRLTDAAGEVAGDIGTAFTSTGYPEPPVNSILDTQTGASGASPNQLPGMTGALMGPQPGMTIKPPAPAYTMTLPPVPGAAAAAPAPVSVPTPAPAPGGPPPPAAQSPLSQVAVPAVKRPPDIPVKAPPKQTTKSASTAPSPAEALNRFYRDQMLGGNLPGAPASVDDARKMAEMGGLTGRYR